MTAPRVRADPHRIGEVAGREVVLEYGDAHAEYDALRSGALLADRCHRSRLQVSGTEAPELLTGMVTSDVKGLTPGHGCYAGALTAKGKLVADPRIFRDRGGLFIDVPPRAAAGWTAMVRKYINPRVAAYRDLSAETAQFAVVGAEARRIVGEVTGVADDRLEAMPPYAHLGGGESSELRVIRSPDLGLEGYELVVAADVGEALWKRLVAAGATPGGLLAWDIARIEAGRPEYGVDIDETTLPQEANFDELQAISYTKGCYVGQETVARIHFRGHVNRHLRGLRFVSPEPPPYHAQLFDAEEKLVGDVRSAAISPRLGGVALGMVRREIDLGTALAARWESGECRVDVSFLPFAL